MRGNCSPFPVLLRSTRRGRSLSQADGQGGQDSIHRCRLLQGTLVEGVAFNRCRLGTVMVERLPHVLEMRRLQLLWLRLKVDTHRFLDASRLLARGMWPSARCCSEADYVPGLSLIDHRSIKIFLYTQEIGVLNVATAIVLESPGQLVILAEGLLRRAKWIVCPSSYKALHQDL
jgi:hypothetical protein